MADTKQIGEVRNSMGNGEARELICTTNGHELRGECWWGQWCRAEGNKGGGEWDNFNSITNKTYFKKKLIIPLKSSLSHYYRLRLYSKKIVNGTRETEMFAVIVQARNDI